MCRGMEVSPVNRSNAKPQRWHRTRSGPRNQGQTKLERSSLCALWLVSSKASAARERSPPRQSQSGRERGSMSAAGPSRLSSMIVSIA